MSDTSQEHPAFSLIRKYVDEAQMEQPQAPQVAAPQDPNQLNFDEQDGAEPQQAEPQTTQPQPQQAAPQAPAPQQQMPQTQFAQQLSPTSIINANHQNVANNEGIYDQGTQQQMQGNNEQAAIDMATNDAKAAALPQLAQIDRDTAAARNAIDEHHMNSTHQAVNDMENTTQEQMKLAQENPHNWWGNASVGGKIAAVIGMVGAGLAHQNASEYFQNIVNNSVAESQRKERVLSNVYRMQHGNMNARDKIHDNQVASLDAKKAAGYQLIANQISQQIALTKNPAVVAKLKTQEGELLQKAADHKATGAQNMVGNDLAALRSQIELQRLDWDKQQAQQAAQKTPAGPPDPNKYLSVGAFDGRGLQSEAYKEGVMRISSAESVVQGIDQARQLLSNPSVNSAYGLKQVNSTILAELRKLQGTGANLSPEEMKNIEALTPAWGDVLRGSLSLVDFNKRLNNAQRLISNSALGYARNVGAPENKLRETSPLYHVMKEQDEEGQSAQQDEGEIKKILGANESENARAVHLEAYAQKHPDSELAKKILQQMSAGRQQAPVPDQANAAAQYGPY